jgi:predicted dehydrogenase
VAVRELVATGAIGAPREVEVERLSATGGRPAWADDEARSGGPMLDLAVHDFDQIVALLGTPVRVQASVGAQGVVEALTEHEGGGSGRLRAGWDLPADSPFTTGLRVTGATGRVDFTSVGSEGRLAVDAPGDSRSERIDPGDPYRDQARYFLEHVRSGTPPEHGDPAASLTALRLALGARAALASGGTVDLA